VVGLVSTSFGLDASVDVLGLPSESAVDEYLFANMNTTRIALVFDGTNATAKQYAYTIQANMTKICGEIGQLYCNDPEKELVSPAQQAIDEAILKLSNPELEAPSITYSFTNFPHQDASNLDSVVPKFIGGFVYLGFILNFIAQGSLILEEKEGGLQEAMSQLGLYKITYWLSWMVMHTAINIVMVVLLGFFGFLFNLEVFTDSSFFLVFFELLLSSFSFTGLAMLFCGVAWKAEQISSFGLYFLYFLGNGVAPVLSLVYWVIYAEKNDDGMRTGLR